MKIILGLIILFVSGFGVCETPSFLLNGSCNEVSDSFVYTTKPSEESSGEIEFEGHRGVVAVFCEREIFKSAMVMFQPKTAEEAAVLYNSLEAGLEQKFGEMDLAKSKEYAEMLYVSQMLIGKAGIMATTVAGKWGADQGNLELALNKISDNWVVVIRFGEP